MRSPKKRSTHYRFKLDILGFGQPISSSEARGKQVDSDTLFTPSEARNIDAVSSQPITSNELRGQDTEFGQPIHSSEARG